MQDIGLTNLQDMGCDLILSQAVCFHALPVYFFLFPVKPPMLVYLPNILKPIQPKPMRLQLLHNCVTAPEGIRMGSQHVGVAAR